MGPRGVGSRCKGDEINNVGRRSADGQSVSLAVRNTQDEGEVCPKG